ncbi:FmdB family transcriptional regulator [Thermosipho melanesiensis]|uniref:FmdB family transcriptional regulator n=2 Tax=Thermosipho melanesiensis TaxID=46541 RepID=A0ABM6GCW5_9BACT|nr:FmdB family zinc ribbon protein [Thermosipho melanesiensis]ABR30149.1 putative regulatory protein, FmdB family [Thermosipho melanesiensis BI429]APT73348.1 FmdB family transcriptional regulator [Thermosipho melanesiensis]OOC38163.1 FmdB family transcriptional regulator [Thermosipho melanesiensis]OOC40084.1 FmdB family transcriptional regulator [Thermosipho melanesiensis]OOC40137.1 FmdB family transcriptional regulator [Thermosipho melanesiensis]
MPMYRYVCKKCGNEKVELHSFNETLELFCDNCGEKMEKAIGRVGIVFKGSGFYITDSKKIQTNSNNSSK